MRRSSAGKFSKSADAPYKSERVEAWNKVKSVLKEQFPVVGFVKDPTGSLHSTSASKRATNWFTYVSRHGLVARCVESNAQKARHRGHPQN